MNRAIAIVGAPSSIGIRLYDTGEARHLDRAPEVFRGLRIVERLGAIDLGDVTPPSYRDYVRPATAREEAYLERRFGDDYRAYKSRVRRWLWETPSSRVVAVARKENIP